MQEDTSRKMGCTTSAIPFHHLVQTLDVAIRIDCTLLAMNPDWIAIIMDVGGAFLQGRFYNNEVRNGSSGTLLTHIRHAK